jgi:dUTP pyrophosphatase
MNVFKKLREDAVLPRRNNPTDAGMDIYCVEPVTLHSGQIALLPTGLAMSIPDGYAGFMWPRSGLSLKGIDVLAGLIDSSYRGEIKVSLVNHGERPIEFKPGDRIAQLVVQPVMLWQPTEAVFLDSTIRGEKGFGSSGL